MPSALERHLSRYLPLTFHERDALDWLERRERHVRAGERVLEQDGPAEALFVVESGWLHSSIRLHDGGRQILRFYFVGELSIACNLAWATSAATLTAVSECVLREIPRANLGRLFNEHPRLAAVLYGLAATEQVAMNDRLATLGRMDGQTRIATLLLELRARLRIADGYEGPDFALPLTQQELGDSLGLTKAHVNRSLRALEERGLIERAGRIIRIPHVDTLAAEVGFVDRYAQMQLDWLPTTRNGSPSDMGHLEGATEVTKETPV